MRTLSVMLVLSSVAACAPIRSNRPAQPVSPALLAPEDSALTTGKRAQFFARRYGWLDGFLMRWTAVGPCIGVYSPDHRGGFVLREIDSLRVDSGVDVGRRPPVNRAALDSLRLPPPAWRNVSVSALRAQEPAPCASA